MRSLRIALAQMNSTVGALAQNREKICKMAAQASSAGAELVIFPELVLCGYPPEDLILKPHFIAAVDTELRLLSQALPPEVVCIVGSPSQGEQNPFNSAVILYQGQVLGRYHKCQLPNYGVFDEYRVFKAGHSPLCLELNGARIGIHICEDSWVHSAEDAACFAQAELSAVVNLSASPFHRGKLPERISILKKTSAACKTPLFYCNLVGGQDELVFDGGSMAISPEGEILVQAERFVEELLVFDLPIKENTTEPPAKLKTLSLTLPTHPKKPLAPRQRPRDLPELEEVYEALKLGIRDYTDKNGFKTILIAISGGIDSALVAALAVDAVGAERVSGISLPTRYSSEGTRSDAILLAENLGIEMPMLPIQDLFTHYLDLLSPQFAGRDADVTEENLQARIRGSIVMALSNKFGSLVVATGNKSEMATGYATLYGDMCGGYALIKDVPKTMVFDLCRWSNQQQGFERIPQSLIDRPPSAELRDDQKDSDSLPPYEILDAILSLYIEQDLGRDEIVAKGFEYDIVTRVIRLVDGNEYKRRQSPPGVKITPKAFGRDRRVPITNHFRPTTPPQKSTCPKK
ncbi:NAD+ synthase [Kiritimatiellota bacterium B12222]|nr:NAD+ synthase [Kiritimatiellota bacterium B12222]